MKWIKYALHSSEAEYDRENKILVNLRAELSNLTVAERSKAKLEFLVIHLSEQDADIINNRTRETQEDLREELRNELPDLVFKIKLEGPRAIENLPPPDNLPSPPISIQFEGTRVAVAGPIEAEMFQGVGKLCELVELYRMRKEDLFSKNVRLFISSKRNVDKGPSGKIRETLKAICVEKNAILPPEIFALYHNGVAISAKDSKLSEGCLSFRDPYVLNGCQTITTAYRFRFGQKVSSQVDEDLWRRITVPIRIIDSRDERLIRTITVSNNRQNAISAAALRANDPVQIDLEQRLGETSLFYERQEGAFEFLEDIDPNKLRRVYGNSEWGPVNIEDIARCLAAAAGEISIAMNVNDLFKSDATYSRCFGQKRISSIHFLTFLQNVHNVLTLVLKNDLGLDWHTSYVKAGRVSYYVLCLFCRYLAKNELFDFVEDYGATIFGRDRSLRDEITKRLDNRHSGIKGQIKERFMNLGDTKMEGLNGAFLKIERSLRLAANIDVFDAFQRFDDRFEE